MILRKLNVVILFFCCLLFAGYSSAQGKNNSPTVTESLEEQSGAQDEDSTAMSYVAAPTHSDQKLHQSTSDTKPTGKFQSERSGQCRWGADQKLHQSTNDTTPLPTRFLVERSRSAGGGTNLKSDLVDPERALRLSLIYTLSGVAAGGVLCGIGFGVMTAAHQAGFWFMIGAGIIGGAGLIVGPSIGHFYAKNFSQAIPMLIARSLLYLGTPFLFFGYVASGEDLVFGTNDCGNDDCPEAKYDNGFLVGGIITASLAVASTVIDIATTGLAAKKHNKRNKKLPKVSVTPALMRTASGGVPGLMVSGTFL